MKTPIGTVTIRSSVGRDTYASIDDALRDIAHNFWKIGVCEDVLNLREYPTSWPWNEPCWTVVDGIHHRHERDGRYTKYRGSVLVQDQYGFTIPRWKIREILLQSGIYKIERIGAFEMARLVRENWRIYYRSSKKKRHRHHKTNPHILQFYRQMRSEEVDPEYREYKIRRRVKPSHLPLYFWFNDDTPHWIGGKPRNWKASRKTQYRN